MTKQEWLELECPESDLRHNKDGSAFIPIKKVKEKLNFLGTWHTHTFDFKLLFLGKTAYASASLILDIGYYTGVSVNNYVRKRITGASTFRISPGGNEQFEATALAECIKNAAKNLGPQFGFNLNQDLTTEDLDLSDMPPQSGEVYETIDEQIKRQANAIEK